MKIFRARATSAQSGVDDKLVTGIPISSLSWSLLKPAPVEVDEQPATDQLLSSLNAKNDFTINVTTRFLPEKPVEVDFFASKTSERNPFVPNSSSDESVNCKLFLAQTLNLYSLN